MAVFFWITIWQFASMYLGQEILLASPVSVVRKLFELSFTGNFWQSVGFSFVRIVTGFLLAMFLGIFLDGIHIRHKMIKDATGSIGEKLYNAKIYLNTPDLFAWTIVIIVISFVFEKCFLGIVSRVVYMIEHK